MAQAVFVMAAVDPIPHKPSHLRPVLSLSSWCLGWQALRRRRLSGGDADGVAGSCPTAILAGAAAVIAVLCAVVAVRSQSAICHHEKAAMCVECLAFSSPRAQNRR